MTNFDPATVPCIAKSSAVMKWHWLCWIKRSLFSKIFRISFICAISLSRNGWKCKSNFMFLQNNSVLKCVSFDWTKKMGHHWFRLWPVQCISSRKKHLNTSSAKWRLFGWDFSVINIGSGNGLLPDGTKPLPEAVINCWALFVKWQPFWSGLNMIKGQRSRLIFLPGAGDSPAATATVLWPSAPGPACCLHHSAYWQLWMDQQWGKCWWFSARLVFLVH